jgi:ornithine cyclodeaminase/alanine dehydrogenase
MRVLTEADVERLLPPPAEAVRLVHEALVALAEGAAEVPPKPTVHLDGTGFANAMPAAMPARNLLGCKWISIVPSNVHLGLPTATGLVVVNDATTGAPTCVMPAAALTAARTAAVTGACVAVLAVSGAPVALIGAGVQARSHLGVLEALGHTEMTFWTRREQAREELVAWAGAHTPAVRLRPADTREVAVSGAAVVVTALPIGLGGMELDPTWVEPDALLLPLDYATSVGPDLAAAASIVAADHREQYETLRQGGSLGPDYPPASHWTGDLLTGPRPAGLLLCQNLGNGLSDLVVADAVARAAESAGVGQLVDTGAA